MKVKAISNFADGSHKQGDVFEIDDAEAERLIAVEAVEATDEEAETQPVADEGEPATETPLETTPPALESEAPKAQEEIVTPPEAPAPGHQPSPEELAQTIQDVEQPSSGDSVQVHIS